MKATKQVLLTAALVLLFVTGLALMQAQQGRQWAGQQIAAQEHLIRTSIALTSAP